MNLSLMLLLYLMLSLGCADELIFERKTVGVGDDVFLNCARQSHRSTSLFWTRVVSGSLPEVLGATFEFDYDGVDQTSRITTKQEPEKYTLHIKNARLNDTGFYYCILVEQLRMTFLKGTFLRFKGKHHLKPQFTYSHSSAHVYIYRHLSACIYRQGFIIFYVYKSKPTENQFIKEY